MRSSLQILLAALAIPMLAGSSERKRSASLIPHADADSSEAVRFIGCYLLTVNSRDSYQVRLTLRRVGIKWDAQAYGLGARNVPGDSWSWTPVDTTAFQILWSGIDSSIEFQITRRRSGLEASGFLYQPGKPGRRIQLETRVRKLTCPPLYI